MYTLAGFDLTTIPQPRPQRHPGQRTVFVDLITTVSRGQLFKKGAMQELLANTTVSRLLFFT
jgi:hypothetical protein